MTLRVSTTGSNVFLKDLGIHILHPTTNRDLSLELSAFELLESEDLTTAIRDGSLTVDNGTYSIAGDDYDSDEALIQQLNIRGDEKYISSAELASIGLTPIVSGVFPLELNSTSNTSKNIYAPAAKWMLWNLEPGDIVSITGNNAAGIYTVESISDSEDFLTKEDIVDSTGGTISIFHPPGSTRVGVDNNNFSVLQSNNLQDILEELDSKFTASGFADEKVKVSSNDTAAGYLQEKLVVTNGLQLTEQNDGNNETLELSLTGSGGETGKKVLSYSWGQGTDANVYVSAYNCWSIMARIIFPGTDHMGSSVDMIKFIGWVYNEIRPMDIRIYDVTNDQVIACVDDLSNEDPQLLDFGTISNVSSGVAIWELQGIRNAHPASYLYVSAMTIFFE